MSTRTVADLPERPFGLPLGVIDVRCQVERAVRLPARDGASLATSLRGAFGAALLRASCTRRPRCDQDGGGCVADAGCPAAWLWKPRSTWQRRHHTPPVTLSPAAGPGGFTLEVHLWGRHAIDGSERVLDALACAGHGGLTGPSGAAEFSVAVLGQEARPLCQWVARGVPARVPRLVQADFETPCHTDDPSPARLAAQAAHDLVQWQLEDEGDSSRLGKRGCDTLADAARAAALRAFAGTRAAPMSLRRVDMGRRASGLDGRRFRLSGFVGSIDLTGDLTACLPWLQVLALRGAGGRRAFGLGAVRLRWSG